MSRKSAYALKRRDPAFAAAWTAAAEASARAAILGDKVEEVNGPPIQRRHGNASPSRIDRERAFVRHLAALRDSVSLAPRPSAQ